MLFQKLAIIATLIALAAGQDITQDDVPVQCTGVCAPVIVLARNCDNQNNDDNAELQCICTAPSASALIPACEACVAQFDTDNDDDVNDVRDVLTRCNFTVQSSYNSASVSSVIASVVSSVASAVASASPSASGSVIVTTSGMAVRTTSVLPEQTQNAAPAMTAAAGLGLGALGLAFGML